MTITFGVEIDEGDVRYLIAFLTRYELYYPLMNALFNQKILGYYEKIYAIIFSQYFRHTPTYASNIRNSRMMADSQTKPITKSWLSVMLNLAFNLYRACVEGPAQLECKQLEVAFCRLPFSIWLRELIRHLEARFLGRRRNPDPAHSIATQEVSFVLVLWSQGVRKEELRKVMVVEGKV